MRWIPIIEKAGDLAPPFDITLIDRSSIEQAIYYLLDNDINVRAYPKVLPQNTLLPAATYQEITGLRQQVLTHPVGMVKSRFQINCWAENYADCDGLADAIREILDGYSGTVSKIQIHNISLDNEIDLINILADISQSKTYGKALDFIVWFKELID